MEKSERIAGVSLICLMAIVGPCIAMQAAPVTDPEWVVIFRVTDKTPPVPSGEDQGQPFDPAEIPFELRLIVRAKTEGEAAIRAKNHVDKYIVASNYDNIKFQEAQRKEKK
jgi:hypothetical protein